MFQPTVGFVKKLLGLIAPGLTNGLGRRKPGQMCVQACVSYALGYEHSDDPHVKDEDGHYTDCINDNVRCLGIWLNDRFRGKKEERAEAMREFAVAQMGSNQVNCAGINGSDIALAMGFADEYFDGRIDRKMWTAMAKEAVERLKKAGSPGCKFLHLCKEKTVPCVGAGCNENK